MKKWNHHLPGDPSHVPRRHARLLAGFLCATLTAGAEADDTVFKGQVLPFFESHCVECHGPEKAKKKLRLDRISEGFAEKAELDHWQDIYDQLADGEMPPEEEPRPDGAAVHGVLTWIAQGLDKAALEAQAEGGRMLIRRLNRTEYDNTIRDLFGLDLKPARVFPEDDSAHGFDNVGSALSVSPLLFEKYLNAAQFVTERVIITERPETVKQRFSGRDLVSGSTFDTARATGHQPPDAPDSIVFFESGPRSENSNNISTYPIAYPRPHFMASVPGEYVIRINASAIGGGANPKIEHTTFWDQKHLKDFPQADMGVILKVFKDEEAIARSHISRKPEVYEFRTFAETQQEFMYRFENGAATVNMERVGKDYPGPGMAVHWIETEGPIYDTWPPAYHSRIFFEGQDAVKDREYARKILDRIATRAFRRPVKTEEVETLLTMFDQSVSHGNAFEVAVGAAIELILCSPSFLYLAEPEPGAKRALNDWEFASRLSYFLWSSMPDDALFEAARNGKLSTDAERAAQVERMLEDPKAEAFTKNFTGQWLKLRKLKTIAVDPKLYREYSPYLQDLFVAETEAFFDEILHHDLSVLNFIQSDFVMLNDRLAHHYGISDVKGPEFRRVALEKGSHRGGLTGQAGILALTTCGSQTSPILRGIWILETLLGYETPPPPRDVPPITPDTTGATTIRDRLAKHREDPACASCHNRIDPLGLALENYDVLGHWRDDYGKHGMYGYEVGKPVDAKVQLTGGESFDGPEEMQELILHSMKDRFCRALTEHLMTYALGRGLELSDRPTVETLLIGLEKNGYKMSPLITGIVLSDPFLTK